MTTTATKFSGLVTRLEAAIKSAEKPKPEYPRTNPASRQASASQASAPGPRS